MWFSFQNKTTFTVSELPNALDPCENDFAKPLDLLPDLGRLVTDLCRRRCSPSLTIEDFRAVEGRSEHAQSSRHAHTLAASTGRSANRPSSPHLLINNKER